MSNNTLPTLVATVATVLTVPTVTVPTVPTVPIVTIFGRIHNIRNKGGMVFVIIRATDDSTTQCIIRKDHPMFDQVSITSLESIVKVTGKKVYANVKSCSIRDYEIVIDEFLVLNKSNAILPFPIEDQNTTIDTRLDKRYFDLRTPINHTIFRLKSVILRLFQQEFLDFTQVQTPKILSTASEGGSSTFEVKYFRQRAFLAQSPQLYKQMLINADFGKVFEVGPVFRAENSNTNRHLCEFTGIDIEMELSGRADPFDYLINFLWLRLKNILTSTDIVSFLNENRVLKISETPLFLSFKDAIKLLRESEASASKTVIDELEDLNTANEFKLGEIIKTRYNSDLFFIINYPTKVRPFYTMIRDDDKDYTRSFDIILKGQEIASGAQREHRHENIIRNMKVKNVETEGLEEYLDSFLYGSKEHGGAGFGLDRIVSLILDLGNIKRGVLFPRDPTRLRP